MADRLQTILEAESKRARKIEQLVGLLRDPDVQDFVNKLFGGEQSALPIEHRSNGNGRQPRSLRAIIRALDGLPQRFTVMDVIAKLRSQNHNFGDVEPKVVVRDALYTLSRPGAEQVYRVAVPSAGGSLNIYERVRREAAA